MSGSPHRTSYIIAGVLALIVLLGLPAALWHGMDCPRCASPRAGSWFTFDIHFCKKGQVTLVQWWIMRRELEREREKFANP